MKKQPTKWKEIALVTLSVIGGVVGVSSLSANYVTVSRYQADVERLYAEIVRIHKRLDLYGVPKAPKSEERED